MELFGILLSAPFFCFVSVIYAILIKKTIDRWGHLSQPAFWVSGMIIVLFLVEVLAVVTSGTIAVREAIGASFYPVHSALFFLVVPSIVNVMRIQKKLKIVSELYVVGPVCGLLGSGIVLFQYVVSEALFGIDGIGGPYSLPEHLPARDLPELCP